MAYSVVNYMVKDNGIAIIEYNRPESLNAVNLAMTVELPQACREAELDPRVKLVIITGAGKGFSSGGDMAALATMKNPIDAKITFDDSGSIARAIYEISKPVIAAVNGPVAGASLASCMACDIILASEKARFGYTFSSIAFCPDNGTSYFLTQKVGYHKAAEILWFGKVLSAQEAYDLQLVNHLYPHETFMDEVMALAEQLLQRPLITAGYVKGLLRQALKNDFYQQADLENLYQVLAYSSPDFMEGVRSFIGKREPDFNQLSLDEVRSRA